MSTRQVAPELQQLYNQFPADTIKYQQMCKITYIVVGLLVIIASMILSRVYEPCIGNYSWLISAGGYLGGTSLICYGGYQFLHPLQDLLKRGAGRDDDPGVVAVRNIVPQYLGRRYELKEELDSLDIFDPRRGIMEAALAQHTEQMRQNAHVMKGFMWEITAGNGAVVHLVASCRFAIDAPPAQGGHSRNLVHADIQAAMRAADTIYVEHDWVEAYEKLVAEDQDDSLDEGVPQPAKPPVVASHLRQIMELARDMGKAPRSIFGVCDINKHLMGNRIVDGLLRTLNYLQKSNRKSLDEDWDRSTILEVLDALQSGNLKTLEKIVKRAAEFLKVVYPEMRRDVSEEFAADIAAKLAEKSGPAVVVLNALECLDVLKLLGTTEAKPMDSESIIAEERLKNALSSTGKITVKRVALA